MFRRMVLSLTAALTFAAMGHAQAIEIQLEPGRRFEPGALLRLPLQCPAEWKPQANVIVEFGNEKAVGQLVPPSFATETIKPKAGHTRQDVVFIVPPLKDGKYRMARVQPRESTKQSSSFHWKVTPDNYSDLTYSDERNFDGKPQPVLRYMFKPYDTSTPDARNRTYKVFHHVFDPAGAGKLLTNGGHTDDGVNPKDMVFPHHRGLMFGVNKCTYDGKTADTWHCTNGVHVSHNKTIHQVAGPVLGEHRVLLDWVGPKDDVFAQEERQMTAYKVPGGTLIEFASRLTPKVSKVKLDGDPQHAGFQFRAHNDVAKKTAKETYYLRPDGKGKLGETRNWDPKNKGPVDLPWNVLSFVLDGKRYSVEYIDHPKNPGEKRYSERDYGRFGCYFEYDLTPENPLVLNHRIWVQEGEMTAEQAQKLRDDFVNPPTVK
jgi:hypothetical protein